MRIMKQIIGFLIVVGIVGGIGCGGDAPTKPDGTCSIIDPRGIKFHLLSASDVKVKIVAKGKTISEWRWDMSAGIHGIYWDRTNDAGDVVDVESYKVQVFTNGNLGCEAKVEAD